MSSSPLSARTKSQYVYSLINAIAAFFNYRFIADDVYGMIRKNLEYFGYINIINSYYNKELNILENFNTENKDSQEITEAFNTLFTIVIFNTI